MARASEPLVSQLVVVASVLVAAGTARAQIGPDITNSSFNDIARHGTNPSGTIVGFSSGSITCNKGDAPMAASPNTSIRPLVCMNMYRFTPASTPGGMTKLQQLGQGWVKWVGVPVNGTNASCSPACSNGGSGFMGVGCADVYSSGFNGVSGMVARSRINATTGFLNGTRGGATGEANITSRVQVNVSDLNGQPTGTRYFFETVHLLPDDASHVRPGQRVAINAMNNATSQEISFATPQSLPAMLASPVIGLAAVSRWAQLDPQVVVANADVDDYPNPSATFPDTTIRTRFVVAARAGQLANGLWRYEYAVYNLNADRACGAISIPLASSLLFADATFSHPPSHSGEVYSNDAWTPRKSGGELRFETIPFDRNANANAIRWGTMYNFGFTTVAAPVEGDVTLDLFKPGPGASTRAIAARLPVPGLPACPADLTQDAGVNNDDLLLCLGLLGEGNPRVDLDNGSGTGTPDGGVTIEDLLYFLQRFEAGC